MFNIFDVFSDRAREVVYGAAEIARKADNDFTGAEHLLLSLLEHKGAVLEKVLAALSADEAEMSKRVSAYVQKGKKKRIPGDDDFTPGVKMILKSAFEESNALGHDYVGPEHIFLGILSESESPAFLVLKNMGITLEKGREKVREYTRVSDRSHSVQTEDDEYLNRFAVDLIEKASQNKLDPVIGREKEIERVIHILSRRMKNNPVLVGGAGVGKTAVVEGLALRIYENMVTEGLRGKKIYSLDMASLVAGAKYMGEFEERLKKVLGIIKGRDDVILFIDEIHTIIGAGRTGGAMDAANIMKPVLARGEIQCIGATTAEEYRQYIEKDPALERRFQPVDIAEPSEAETENIIRGIREKYETFHRVKISDGAVEAAVRLSIRYIPDRYLPDKAVDLIDEASAKVRLESLIVPEKLAGIDRELKRIRVEKESAFNDGDYEQVANLGIEEKKLEAERETMRQEWDEDKARRQRDNIVRKEDVAQIVSRWSGVPVTRLSADESQRYAEMEDALHKRVVGQDEAVRLVSDVLRVARSGLSDPEKPAGVFLFLGPTGVGKTEVAKALSEFEYGDESHLIRLDMSEYMEKHSVSRLIGSPPGYVGHEEGGQLSEAVRRRPFSVILFDEIEKAHRDVLNVLLQVFDEGRLTDGRGRTVNFKNTVIIMTSNIGSQQILDSLSAGDGRAAAYDDVKSIVEGLLSEYFRPEFVNRIDETVIFRPLGREEIKRIARLRVDEVISRIKDRDINVKISEDVWDYLADRGFDALMGARPLKRMIHREIVTALSAMLLKGELQEGGTVDIDSDGKKINMEILS